MKLYLVHLHGNAPPMLVFGKTRAYVGRQMKNFLGDDMVDEVVPISNQDAESEYGYDYKKMARFNMIRSEKVSNTSMLTGDNPFLREKMDMKKADMGDVIDDFKKSDAPQFQGKSMAKRRQMAIAAKLSANEEQKESLKLSKISEGIDQKLLKQFKAMLKDNEEDSVRMLLQGMPKHVKKMYMTRLGIKETSTVDGRTRAFRETIKRLNMAKSVPVQEDTYKGVEIGKWKYKGPREFAEKLIDKFGKPDHVEMNPETGEAGSVLFNDIDGFDFVRIVDSNTNKLHPYPAKIYVEGGLYFKVPREMVGKLKEASPTIIIDELNGFVIGKCASLGIAAATVQFVIDAVNENAPPTREEYDKRLRSIIDNNKYEPEISWWENSLNEDVEQVDEDKKMLKIAKSLEKSSKGHKKQAKYLKKHVKDMEKQHDENYVVQQYKDSKRTTVRRTFPSLKAATAHANTQNQDSNLDHRVTREDMDDVNELDQKTMNTYHSKAQRSMDRAKNSHDANILRGTDPSKDKATINKRAKGMNLAKSRTIDKMRKLTDDVKETPVKMMVKDRKLKNLKVPNPNYKGPKFRTRDNERSADTMRTENIFGDNPFRDVKEAMMSTSKGPFGINPKVGVKVMQGGKEVKPTPPKIGVVSYTGGKKDKLPPHLSGKNENVDEMGVGFATRTQPRATIKKKVAPITPGPRDRMAALRKRLRADETKQAPPGTYFTRSGQLKKGDPASDGSGGAKLASDPLDKQRKTIVNLKNYPK